LGVWREAIKSTPHIEELKASEDTTYRIELSTEGVLKVGSIGRLVCQSGGYLVASPGVLPFDERKRQVEEVKKEDF